MSNFAQFELDPNNLPDDLTVDATVEPEGEAATPTSTAAQPDNSLTNTLKELPIAAYNGVGKAVNEVMDLGEATVNFVSDVVDKGYGEAKFQEPTEEARNLPRFTPYATSSTTAKFVEPVTQFVTSFIGAGKFMKGAKLLQGSSVAVRTGVQGGIADFIGFDAHEANLSSLIESVPELRNPITRALASNEDRSMIEGRLSNVLEGILSGYFLEGAIKGVSMATTKSVMGVKRLRNLKNTDEIPVALREIEAEVNEALATAKPRDEGSVKAPDANPADADGIKSTEAKATDEALTEASEAPAPKTKQPYKSPYDAHTETFLKTIKESESAEEAVTGFYAGRNFDRILFEGLEGSHVLKQAHDLIKDKLRNNTTLSGDAVARSSMKHLEDYGIDYTETFEALKGKPHSVRALNEHLLDLDAKIINLSEGVRHYGSLINRGDGSELVKYRFDMMTSQLMDLEKRTTDITTEIARTLAHRKNARSYDDALKHLQVKDNDEFLERWFNNTGKPITEEEAARLNKERGISPEQREHVARILSIAGDDKKLLMKVAKAHRKEVTRWDIYKELYIEGLLSGWKTLLSNPASNALKTFMKPTSEWIGATITGDARSRRIAAGTVTGLMRHVGDSLSLAKRSWKLDRSILDPDMRTLEGLPNASYLANYDTIKEVMLRGSGRQELSVMEEWGARVIGNYLGPGLHKITKAMNFGDELFKQMYFRANLESRLTEEALEKGIRGSNVADYIRMGFDKALDANGGAVNEGLGALALQGAREATWTTELAKGSLGARLQTISRETWYGTLTMPFVRTPTNLLIDLVNHTPLATLRPDIWRAFNAGGEARAKVVGELATGAMLLTSAGFLAKGGLITGSPPKDPEEYARLLATGWEPYSIKTGDTYWSYRRFDPFAGLLNIAADMVTFESRLPDDADWMEIGYEAIANVASATVLTVSSKTYYQGAMDMLEVIQDPERNLKNKTSKLIGAMLVPGSSGVRSIRQLTDPYLREMDGPLDTIRNGLPNMALPGKINPMSSSALPKKHDWVTGQPIEYSRIYGEDKNDDVLTELAELGKGVIGRPDKSISGVKLTTEEYSRYCQLHGTVKIGGKTLSERLGDLFSMEAYKAMPEVTPGYPGPRHAAVNRLVSLYRDEAQEKLMEENIDLDKRVTTELIMKRGSKAGMETKDLRGLINSL